MRQTADYRTERENNGRKPRPLAERSPDASTGPGPRAQTHVLSQAQTPPSGGFRARPRRASSAALTAELHSRFWGALGYFGLGQGGCAVVTQSAPKRRRTSGPGVQPLPPAQNAPTGRHNSATDAGCASKGRGRGQSVKPTRAHRVISGRRRAGSASTHAAPASEETR